MPPQRDHPPGKVPNYSLQLVAQIRRYKGARHVPVATGFSPITIDESFADWKAVNTTYRDDAGDITPRDHHGWGRFARYENNSGRHGLTLAKVACDAAIPQTVAA